MGLGNYRVRKQVSILISRYNSHSGIVNLIPTK